MLLHFLTFWPFGLSFPFILALLGLHFLCFWPFGASFPSFGHFGRWFPFILAFGAVQKAHPPSQDLAQNCNFPFKFCNFFFSKICGFGPSFWPFGASFLTFGLLLLHFLTFWPFVPSFPFILALLGLHFLCFWPFGAHPARIWPKITISLLDFAIFPFQKFADLGRKRTNQKPKQHIEISGPRFVLEVFGAFELSCSKV